MKKGRFLWSAHRITEKQKAGKARNIKEKQLKNSRNTASKPPVARLSSPSAEKCIHFSPGKPLVFRGFSFLFHAGQRPPHRHFAALANLPASPLLYFGAAYVAVFCKRRTFMPTFPPPLDFAYQEDDNK